MATLARNEQEITSLIANHPSTLLERNLFGQTPIHLAISRPSCLRLLLKDIGISAVDQPDFSGFTPLEYAAMSCRELCEASVVMILESDCRVPNQFSPILSNLCKVCKAEFLKHMKNRRERLKRFALERLPGADAAVLGLHQAAVLDSKASLVIQILEKRGFEIPSALRVNVCLANREGRLDALNVENDLYQPVSMFHQSPLNALYGCNFEALYQLGFRDFEEPTSLEISPMCSWITRPLYVPRPKDHIWELNRIEACIWLIKHGANLWDPISEDAPTTTAHYLYGSLHLAEETIYRADPATVSSQFLTSVLAAHDVRDNCHCRCSPGGCTPFIWFLRSNTDLKYVYTDYDNYGAYITDRFPDFLYEWKPNLTTEQLRSAVRYLTFDILGIRHTCSHARTQVDKPTEDEIQELMSEDVSLLELLEQLVETFDLELQSSITEEDPLGLPFWKTHWAVRMKELLATLDEYRMDDDELLSAQQLGVIWHHLDANPGKDRMQQDDGPSYRREMPRLPRAPQLSYDKSEWSVDFDDERMWFSLRSLADWRSRLDLIMSRAIPDWRCISEMDLAPICSDSDSDPDSDSD